MCVCQAELSDVCPVYCNAGIVGPCMFFIYFLFILFFLEGVGGRGQLKTKYLMYFMWPCSVVIVYWTVPVLSWVPYLHVYLFIDA